jgi:putative isomerase
MQQINKIIEEILESVQGTLKEPEGELKHPYLSPGGPYATNLWDWDSYWTLFAFLGIANKLERSDLIDKIAPYARGVLFNFLEHQGEDGALPILITPDDDDLFDCKKSADNNMAKPFIAQTASLLLQNNLLNKEDLKERIYQIRAFHQCYEKRYTHSPTGLLFWAKDWGIGVDDDPACWGRPEKSCGSIFLNTFFYKDLMAGAELSDLVGRPDYAMEYREKARKLAAAIQKYCWDEREKAFFSVDIQCRQNLTKHRAWGMLNFKLDPFWHVLKLKILSWNCILPLWAGIGTQEQTDAFVKEHLVAGRLLSDYGVRSLSLDEPMYAPEVARGNPSNWLGPIWILVNYITWETLVNYGHKDFAGQLSNLILNLLGDDLTKNGVFHEYYSPETGKPVCSPGFVSWNALAGLLEDAK